MSIKKITTIDTKEVKSGNVISQKSLDDDIIRIKILKAEPHFTKRFNPLIFKKREEFIDDNDEQKGVSPFSFLTADYNLLAKKSNYFATCFGSTNFEEGMTREIDLSEYNRDHVIFIINVLEQGLKVNLTSNLNYNLISSDNYIEDYSSDSYYKPRVSDAVKNDNMYELLNLAKMLDVEELVEMITSIIYNTLKETIINSLYGKNNFFDFVNKKYVNKDALIEPIASRIKNVFMDEIKSYSNYGFNKENMILTLISFASYSFIGEIIQYLAGLNPYFIGTVRKYNTDEVKKMFIKHEK